MFDSLVSYRPLGVNLLFTSRVEGAATTRGDLVRAFDNPPGSLAERLRELVAAEVAAHSEVVGGAAGSCELTWSTCYSRHSIYAELITDRRTTAGRGGLRARQQMAVVQTQETSNIHRKWYLAGPLTRLHDAVCRRWLRRSPAVSWSEVATLCAHARRPKRSWATNVSRSRSVHPLASSQWFRVARSGPRHTVPGTGTRRAVETRLGCQLVAPRNRHQLGGSDRRDHPGRRATFAIASHHTSPPPRRCRRLKAQSPAA